MTRSMTSASQAAQRAFSPERTAGIEIPTDREIARLHVGDPCFRTPRHIIDAATAAMAEGYTNYPPSSGDPELRRAIAARASARATHPIDSADVLVTAGSTEAIFCAFTALLDPGDEVILFDPIYSLYATLLNQIGAKPVYAAMTAERRPDLEKLRRAITGRTRMVIINNPVNPTGVVFDESELRGIAEVAVSNDLLVLADEIYDELVFTGTFTSCLAIPELAERLVYVNGFSKTYAMTGWRLGYLIAPPDLLRPAQVIHSNIVAGVNWPAQRAGIAALQGPTEPVTEMIAGYDARRHALLEGLAGTPGLQPIPPEGAFYLYVGFKFQRPISSANLTKLLLTEGVAVRSGTEYGPAGEGYLRLSYSASFDDIRRGAERLRRAFTKLSAGRQT
ncbi:MAG: aminotransferase class I/II-fold pyridoxal phosphate-dependent enzyme [Candidatus Dormibacteraeota bacterium]|nr:aminotransferase class I/II-fold pyridoxal phosphate-dependent enzyme [Candidatus Dormibacteraeota bacterium]